jgi:hypothetical protein
MAGSLLSGFDNTALPTVHMKVVVRPNDPLLYRWMLVKTVKR